MRWTRRLDGRACGSMGTVGIYSFDAVKNLAMGEGGGLTARDPELVARARTLRYCGIGKSGFRLRRQGALVGVSRSSTSCRSCCRTMSSASIGLAQLAKLDALQATRKRFWERYQRELTQIDWLARPQDPGSARAALVTSRYLRARAGRAARPAREVSSTSKGIYTTLRYHPLHMNPIYKSVAKLPNCEQLNEEGLNLPLHPNLSDADLDQVLSALRSFGG